MMESTHSKHRCSTMGHISNDDIRVIVLVDPDQTDQLRLMSNSSRQLKPIPYQQVKFENVDMLWSLQHLNPERPDVFTARNER